MSIKYVCQYCKTTIGQIDSADVSEMKLGLHFLTPEERQHIISYEANGDIVANIACEYCSEAINRHPELVNPLQ
jgi:DNA-directed RNA polymerase subunit RPC12/RpoP